MSAGPNATVRTREFDPGTDYLNGIVAYLTRECGGNVHDLHIAEALSSPSDGEEHAARNIADLRTATYFRSAHRAESEDIPHRRNAWVGYDLHDHRIMPTHYTIKTADDAFIRSWVVEASDDAEYWSEIDRREDIAKSNAADTILCFPVSVSRQCRMIRLVNVGRNHLGTDELRISGFELFGTLMPGATMMRELADRPGPKRVSESEQERAERLATLIAEREKLEQRVREKAEQSTRVPAAPAYSPPARRAERQIWEPVAYAPRRVAVPA
jgi:hypothetical protein